MTFAMPEEAETETTMLNDELVQPHAKCVDKELVSAT